ncbi:MAG: protein-tyrosine phosphatase, partial [Flavobacteriales bacterium]
MSRPTNVLFLCLGNICRSPLAEGLFREHVSRMGLAEEFIVDSAGTSAYHAGEPPDPGSVYVAATHGLDLSAQRSRPLRRQDLQDFDFIIPMDRSNEHSLRQTGDPGTDRAPLLRRFDPTDDPNVDVPDPYRGASGG